MEVRYDEGIASHIGPEPCAGIREDVGEASVGECTGQPLSRERVCFRVPTPSTGWKAKWADAQARVSVWPGVVAEPWHVQTLLVREPGDLWIGHPRQDDGMDGPQREGEEP